MPDLAKQERELEALNASLLRSILVVVAAGAIGGVARRYDEAFPLFLLVWPVAFVVGFVYFVVVLHTEEEIERVIKATGIWPREWYWFLWGVRLVVPVVGTLVIAFLFSLSLRHMLRKSTHQLPPPARTMHA